MTGQFFERQYIILAAAVCFVVLDLLVDVRLVHTNNSTKSSDTLGGVQPEKCANAAASDPLKCCTLITKHSIGWSKFYPTNTSKYFKTIHHRRLPAVKSPELLQTEGFLWRFHVPEGAIEACGISDRDLDDDLFPQDGEGHYFYPISSTPESIGRAMSGKHIILVGDSSFRMIYDFLVGRAVGGYKEWPDGLGQHGPAEHTRSCGFSNRACGYNFLWGGGQISFYWAGDKTNLALEKYLSETVGNPDLFVVAHGYWNAEDFEKGERFLRSIDQIISREEMNNTYPFAYSEKPKRRKIFMTPFDPEVAGGEGARKQAELLGWSIFDRSKVTTPPQGITKQAHPMGVVMEMQLELLVAVIRATRVDCMGCLP